MSPVGHHTVRTDVRGLLLEARNAGSTQIKQFVEHFPIVPLADAAEEYAIIKTRLRSSGILIDEFDLMIAATALSDDYILVTDNIKHFRRIPDLKLENWIKR